MAPFFLGLVGEICGSPIRSNGGPRAQFAQPANPMRDSAAWRFAGVTRASCRRTPNPQYFAIPQIWFSTGNTRRVRDLMRDLQRVNRGESKPLRTPIRTIEKTSTFDNGVAFALPKIKFVLTEECSGG
jgi:hypothetical protein